jgi:hypothetical protein
VVKRWLKGEGGGLLAVARGMVRGQHGADGDLTGEVEMRFEWKRGKAKRRREKEREREKGEGENGSMASRRKPSTGNLTPQKRLSLSVISRQSSFSTTAGASEEGYLDAAARRRPSVAPGDGEDSGDESDPEDSETPWTCTVKVRRIAAPHARGHSHSHSFGSGRHNPEQEQQEQEQGEQDRARWKKEVLRIKVGTLSPTPHHPKVVAMLKVPFPLPDVDVERLVVHKRDAPRPGESVSPPGVKGGELPFCFLSAHLRVLKRGCRTRPVDHSGGDQGRGVQYGAVARRARGLWRDRQGQPQGRRVAASGVGEPEPTLCW